MHIANQLIWYSVCMNQQRNHGGGAHSGEDKEMQKLMQMLQSGVHSAHNHTQEQTTTSTHTSRHMTTTEKSSVRNAYVIAALVIGLLVGFGVGRVSARPTISNETEEQVEEIMVPTKEDLPGAEEEAAKETRPVQITTDSNFIEVKDQAAGINVFITRVGLTHTGWVAIHEDRDGDLGNILGAKLFETGVSQGSVPLLRETATKKTYYAVLYADDGDHVFNFKKDPVLAETAGQPILFAFDTF